MNKVLILNPSGYRILPKIILAVMFVLFLFLLILYIFQIQEIIKKGYELSRYQKSIQLLTQENASLARTTSFLLSVQAAEDMAQDLGLVRVKQVKYLPLSPASLVRSPR